MKKNIEISIIIPIYKIKLEYLKKCLDSILNNNSDQIEIILVDDNNYNDECGKIIDLYAKKFENVTAIHQENAGVSVARNSGIDNSKGKYIAFVDPDDWVTENFVQEMINSIEDDQKSDIIIFSSFVNYNNIQIINNFWFKDNMFIGSEKEDLELQLIAKGATKYFPPEVGVGVPWSKLYKKSFLLDNNLRFIPNLKRMQDNIFNLYAFEYANQIRIINIPIYHYRKSSESATNKKDEMVINKFELVNKEVYSFIKKFGKSPIFYRALDIKRIIGVNSYYLLKFSHYSNLKEFKNRAKEYKRLLTSEVYSKSLKNLDYRFLLPKEKIFVSFLKTNSFIMLVMLQKSQQLLNRLKGKIIDGN